MSRGGDLARKEGTVGDAAVDGLISGSLAGVLMAVCLVVLQLLTGRAIGAILAPPNTDSGAGIVTGVVTHLAVAGVYGVLFGVGWRLATRQRAPFPAWVGGVLYGGLLWLLATAFMGAGGSLSGMHWLEAAGPVPLALSHGLYGLALGWAVDRLRARPPT